MATLDRQTGITLGLAVMVLAAAVSSAWWFGQWVGRDTAWKDSTDTRLESIEEALSTGTAARWTSRDMRRWAERLRESNPDLSIPEPFAADFD